MDGGPLITIIIPVKNGDYWLEGLFRRLVKQTLFDRSEILVIDSGSTDRSLEIINRFPVRLVQIPAGEFNHGATRNLGVQSARGKYVVMTVQDAQPTDERWLEKLLEGFDGEDVAGVCGQQIVPHDPDKNPVEWFRPFSPPGKRKYSYSRAEFDRLSPAEKRQVCGWDNVNAIYDRKVLIEVPFRPLTFAEDGMWAKDALEAGYAIVYNTAARVNHYHFETPEYAFKRYFTVAYHFYKFFGLTPSYGGSEIVALLRNIRILWRERQVRWKDKWKWLLYNYKWRRAVHRSVQVFNAALNKGAKELDAVHTRICGAPPQAVKPTSAI
jgi:rhamnosyltransferase